MNKIKKDEELLSRRAFFRRGVSSILPIIASAPIISAFVASCNPPISLDALLDGEDNIIDNPGGAGESGGGGGTQYGCGRVCASSCDSGCQEGCTSACGRSCFSGCSTSCDNDCASGCYGTCKTLSKYDKSCRLCYSSCYGGCVKGCTNSCSQTCKNGASIERE